MKNMLHPKKYETHVLDDLMEFYEGVIGYPEIDLRLAGEEAWLKAVNPKLAEAVRKIIRTIRRYLEGSPYDGTNKPIPRYIIAEIFSQIAPEVQLLVDALDTNGKYGFLKHIKKLNLNSLALLSKNYNENEKLWKELENEGYVYLE
ncbi:MAG: hypothetical protein OWQ50_01120 [Acidianus infernus]|nr:hypothetical protein [Acidianus infernus]